ncbi:MAG TPA: hypothetical protein VIJ30_03790 [Candidatus Dormibacteraeota bacterium]
MTEDLREGRYRAGFSCPVVVSAIRQLRREQSFIPAPAEVLQACLKHRRGFRDLVWTMDVLIEVRANAEEVLVEDKRQYREDFGDDEDEPVQHNPRRWHRPYVDDPADVPF